MPCALLGKMDRSAEHHKGLVVRRTPADRPGRGRDVRSLPPSRCWTATARPKADVAALEEVLLRVAAITRRLDPSGG
jgi:hypothetical protein